MIASIAAQGVKVPEQNLSIYNASKAGVKGMVGPLAVELADLGIRVNSISPGVILSPMTNALKTQYPKLLNMFENAAPVGRIGVPTDLTPQVVLLLSDASSFTVSSGRSNDLSGRTGTYVIFLFQTGTDVVISGGLHAGVAPRQMAKALS